jgi:hypothetical protein
MRHSIRGVVALIITAILLTLFLSSCGTPNYRVTGFEIDPTSGDTLFIDALIRAESEEKLIQAFSPAKQRMKYTHYLRVDEWKDAKQLRGRKVLEYKRKRDE